MFAVAVAAVVVLFIIVLFCLLMFVCLLAYLMFCLSTCLLVAVLGYCFCCLFIVNICLLLLLLSLFCLLFVCLFNILFIYLFDCCCPRLLLLMVLLRRSPNLHKPGVVLHHVLVGFYHRPGFHTKMSDALPLEILQHIRSCSSLRDQPKNIKTSPLSKCSTNVNNM